MHSPTTPQKNKISPNHKIQKRKKKQDKNQRRKKIIIKINKYSLVYIVKCAFILSYFLIKLESKSELLPERDAIFVIKKLIYLPPSKLNNRLIPHSCEQPPLSGLRLLVFGL